MHVEQSVEQLRRMAAMSFLATADGDQPCSRAMTHYIDNDGTIWYPTLLESAKVRQIAANPKVAVSFFDPQGRAAPVSVYGTAEIITDCVNCEHIWQGFGPSITKIVPAGPGSANFAFIKITPKSIVANTYRRTGG